MRYPARSAMSKNLVIAIGASLALAACGGNPRIEGLSTSPATKPKGPVADWPVKIGSPYQVLGRWYYPKDGSEEHTSELQSLMRISYAVFCLKQKQLAK